MKIEKEGGKQVDVPIEKLSPADHEYLHGVLRVDLTASVSIGKVIEVNEGDLITIRDTTSTEHKVRLEGVDAPEAKQTVGPAAKRFLHAKLQDQTVWIEWRSVDDTGARRARVYLDGRDMNLETVAAGYAWHDKAANSDGRLANAEIVARQRKLGLWNEEKKAVPPWEFRKGVR